MNSPVCCLKEEETKKGREQEALQTISGAITGGNGSHLSHLDIWEDLWLHKRGGQAEVSEERVLHRGLWRGSDDMPPLQQWEVKGKNNRALGERAQSGTAGSTRTLSFFTLTVIALFLSSTPAHRHTHNLHGGRKYWSISSYPILEWRFRGPYTSSQCYRPL